MQAREYPFLDSDILVILEELLKEKLVELPESKLPEDANMSSKPNYFTFKERVMSLARHGTISCDYCNKST
ncbi:hypothetical protein LIER_02850 [Lithospermum erythrorhizon]|uniref:Uncharacterized protein n=1 Tax=Lithospermum erythrorhizon TaxID=34254 RepID=A0AAV3NVP9_LITER